MLKLRHFPRGNNRNRSLKRLSVVDFESPQEVERVFRRFWRERKASRQGSIAGEGGSCA